MEKVLAKTVPCESCAATGRCSTCGGSGELPNDGICLECAGGLCMVCCGTGKELEFEVGGRPLTWRARLWRTWLGGGLALLAFGIVLSALRLSGNESLLKAYDDPVVQFWAPVVLLLVVGTLFIPYGIRMWSLQRQMKRADSDFYAAADRAIDEAEEALTERRRQRGLE